MTNTQPLDPALVQRMVELVRKMAGSYFVFTDHHTEACAIAALLPAPVDPAVLACREIVAAEVERQWPLIASRTRRGMQDDSEGMRIALAAYNAGQERARG